MRGTWDDLNRRLTGAILALDLHDALVIREQREQPKRGLFGRRTGAGPPVRYVQITAAQSVLIAECVGSTSFGGPIEMSAETEATLAKQGWERPWSDEQHTWQREAPLQMAPRLALVAVRALQTLGCEMAELEVKLVREDPDA